jgi:hypothetical protein
MKQIEMTYADLLAGRSSWRVTVLFCAISLAITAVYLS